jgi:CheY-specific phosphatase CheX
MQDPSSHIEAIAQRLLEATGQVFEERGVTLSASTRCDPVGDWLDPISVMGFGGETLRGSVSFEVPWRVLQASHPTNSAVTVDLVDWVGELSNLVVGKLKTKLRTHGVIIQPGLPTTFTTGATQAKQTGATGAPQLQYRLRAPDGAILVRFNAELAEAFEMTAPHRAEVVHEIELF